MRNIKYLLVTFFSMFIMFLTVNADCTSEELLNYRNAASLVKSSYEVVTVETNIKADETEEDEKVKIDYFKVNLSNTSNDFYIVLEDQDTKTQKYLTQPNENGIMSATYNVSSDKNYTINYTVYTSNNTLCPNEKLFENYITLPHFNNYSLTQFCFDNKTLEECKSYITKKITSEDFQKKVQEVNSKKAEEETLKRKQDRKKKISLILIGSIAGGIILLIIFVKVFARIRSKRVRGI